MGLKHHGPRIAASKYQVIFFHHQVSFTFIKLLLIVGKPYVWGAKGPERFDCSGLTQWLYAQIGIQIPTGTGRGGNGGQWGLP